VEVGEKLEGFYLGIMSDMRSFIYGIGDGVVQGIDFIKTHFADIQAEIAVMSKEMSESLNNINTSGVMQAAGAVFSDFVHNVWAGVRPVIESLWQFKDQAVAVFEFVGKAIGVFMTGMGEYIGFIYSYIAGVIDVLHTVYVALDKVGVVWVYLEGFRMLGAILEGVGHVLGSIYESVIKPIAEAIGGVYHMIKDLLGIKDATMKVKFSMLNDVPQTGFGPGLSHAGADGGGIGGFDSKGKNDNILAETRGGVSAAGAGNHVRNVIVTIEKFIGIENMTYDHAVHNTRKIEQVVSNMFTNSIRDSEIALGQQ
jgi:hypothetical protein